MSIIQIISFVVMMHNAKEEPYFVEELLGHLIMDMKILILFYIP